MAERTRPLVSVIIPTYNGERFIRETIDSALAQTIPDVELIVINDGSTDSTPEILESYGSRINIIHKDNGGVASARNAGIRNAQGKWIAFLDHDDLWQPNKLEKQLSFLDAHPSYSMLYSLALQARSRNGELCETKVIGRAPDPRHTVYESLFRANFIPAMTVIVCKDTLINVGFFDEGVQPADDWDMWLRISREFSVGFLPEVVGTFRIHESNFHHNNISLMATALQAALNKHISQAPKSIAMREVYLKHYCYFASQAANVADMSGAMHYLLKAAKLGIWSKELLFTFSYVIAKFIERGLNAITSGRHPA